MCVCVGGGWGMCCFVFLLFFYFIFSRIEGLYHIIGGAHSTTFNLNENLKQVLTQAVGTYIVNFGICISKNNFIL